MIFRSQQEDARELRKRIQPELVSTLAARLIEIIDEHERTASA